MAVRNRFELDILCPNCGAHGDACVFENAPDMSAPVFRVEAYPLGFFEEKPSATRHETMVRCQCGQVFYLL